MLFFVDTVVQLFGGRWCYVKIKQVTSQNDCADLISVYGNYPDS